MARWLALDKGLITQRAAKLASTVVLGAFTSGMTTGA